jgi:hypothetical protein
MESPDDLLSALQQALLGVETLSTTQLHLATYAQKKRGGFHERLLQYCDTAEHSGCSLSYGNPPLTIEP